MDALTRSFHPSPLTSLSPVLTLPRTLVSAGDLLYQIECARIILVYSTPRLCECLRAVAFVILGALDLCAKGAVILLSTTHDETKYALQME